MRGGAATGLRSRPHARSAQRQSSLSHALRPAPLFITSAYIRWSRCSSNLMAFDHLGPQPSDSPKPPVRPRPPAQWPPVGFAPRSARVYQMYTTLGGWVVGGGALFPSMLWALASTAVMAQTAKLRIPLAALLIPRSPPPRTLAGPLLPPYASSPFPTPHKMRSGQTGWHGDPTTGVAAGRAGQAAQGLGEPPSAPRGTPCLSDHQYCPRTGGGK